MNFLAHLYLSGESMPVLLGNFMADFVKGNPETRVRQQGMPADVQEGIIRGIQLHRRIDHFTDTHPRVLESKVRLRATYRKYAGVITDIFYDHFLAAHWHHYSAEPLDAFASRVYATLETHRAYLPATMDRLLYYMTRQNWLVSYAYLEGIERALQGMAQRTTFQSGMETAVAALRQDYGLFYREFADFFPELEKHARTFLKEA